VDGVQLWGSSTVAIDLFAKLDFCTKESDNSAKQEVLGQGR